MCLYDKWLKKKPIDPISDLMELKKKPREKKKFLSSLDQDSVRHDWNIFSVVLCWDCSSQVKKKIIRELVLAGGDLNAHGFLGITPLHTILLRVVYCNEKPEMFTFLLKCGLDWSARAFFNPKFQTDTESVMTPLDFFNHIQKNSETVGLLSTTKLSDPKENLDTIRQITEFFENPEESYLEHDVKLSRYKLMDTLGLEEVRKRVRLIQQFHDYIDFLAVKRERNRLFFMSGQEAVYLNGLFYDKEEFMPYEYLTYLDGHKRFYFHKNFVTTLFRTGINPLTNVPIPPITLCRWFDELQQSSYSHGIFTLEDAFQDPQDTGSASDQIYYYLYNHVVESHPYNNIFELSRFTNEEINCIAHYLTQPPFRCRVFAFIDQCEKNKKDVFARYCLSYMMENRKNNFISSLHFALEETIQDLKMLTRFRLLCQEKNIPFQTKSFNEACSTIFEIYEMLLERTGMFDNLTFKTIWNRLVHYHISSSPSKSSSSSSTPSTKESSSLSSSSLSSNIKSSSS